MPDRDAVTRVHPCLDQAARRWFGRLHLAVAPRCNLKCRYCTRRYDCANESRPGVTSKVLKPRQALARVRQALQREPRIRVVGIAGPGDPLANPETLETFRLVRREYSELVLCLSTNGLVLEDSLPELVQVGVKVVTVTVNTVQPRVGEAIYRWAYYGGEVYRGREAAELLLERQLAGIRAAGAAGLVVKVNTVLIPGLNEGELPAVAREVRRAGAHYMNIMPLIPQGEFQNWPAPTPVELRDARRSAAGLIKQLTHCTQCRADAAGLLGCREGV